MHKAIRLVRMNRLSRQGGRRLGGVGRAER